MSHFDSVVISNYNKVFIHKYGDIGFEWREAIEVFVIYYSFVSKSSCFDADMWSQQMQIIYT